MSQRATDEQIAALQHEIESVGQNVTQLRTCVRTVIALLVVGLTAFVCFIGASAHADFPEAPGSRERQILGVFLAGLAAAVLLGLAVALPAAAGARRWDRRNLRRKLAPLDGADRARVLLPLREIAHGDAAKLVEPLIRELIIPTELCVADAPGARGDEVSAGE